MAVELDLDSPLYRQLTSYMWIKYDPRDDQFSVLPDTAIPPVRPILETRLRLSLATGQSAATADGDGSGEEFRRACLAAMLEFQYRAHKIGRPEAAAPYLEAIAKLASDPDGPKKLQLSWVAGRTRKGTVKAVGEGDHEGKTVYGKRAQDLLRNQQKRKDAHRLGERARAILSNIHTKGVSHADLTELATHLPALSVERLRHARILLGTSWAGQGKRRADMVKRLQDHIAKIVKGRRRIGSVENAKTPKPRKKRTEESFVSLIKHFGGINPSDPAFKSVFSSVKEAMESGVSLGVFKKNGERLDVIAKQMESGGYMTTPSDTHAHVHLMNMIIKRAGKHLESVEDQYIKYNQRYDEELADARRYASESEIAEAIRSGEAAGESEGRTGPIEDRSGGTGDDSGSSGNADEDSDERGDAWEPDSVADVEGTTFDFGDEQTPKPSHLDDDAFAKKVNQIADDHTHGFGNNKVFIADVFDKLKEEDPSLTLEDFKKRLKQVSDVGKITLSRADLTQLMHPDWVNRSEIRHLPGEHSPTSHFVLTNKKKDRLPREMPKEDQFHNKMLNAWEKSGTDRVNMLHDMLKSGRVSNLDGIAEAIRNYANNASHIKNPVGQKVDAAARELIGKMTPEQRKNLASEYRGMNKNNDEVAPVMSELLKQQEPQEHEKHRKSAIDTLAKLPGLTDQQREDFASRIQAVKGDDESEVMNKAYGVLDEAKAASKAAKKSAIAEPPSSVNSSPMSSPVPTPEPPPPPSPVTPTTPVGKKYEYALNINKQDEDHDAAVKNRDTLPQQIREAYADPSKWDQVAANALKPGVFRSHLVAIVKDLFGDDAGKAAGRMLPKQIVEWLRNQKLPPKS